MTMNAVKSAALGLVLALLLTLVPFVNVASAQDNYPVRPITIIVPFAPGGGGDIVSRLLSQHLEKRLGQPIVIENRPGAGGLTGTVAASKANPDGYTLLMVPSGPMVVNSTLFKKLDYDPVESFVPIGLIAGTPFALIVHPAVPAKSVAELVALQKKAGKAMDFAISGAGLPHHLFTEMFKVETGIETNYVPYKGSLPALNDVVAGHVPVMFNGLNAAGGMIEAGKVRALAVTTRNRVGSFPDIPTLHETIAPGFDASSWQMLVAPAKTPRAIVEQLNIVLKDALAQPQIGKFIIDNGMVAMPEMSVGELRKFLDEEIARWGKVVRNAGLAGSR